MGDINHKKLTDIIDNFSSKKIAIFGDLMIDKFIKGKVRRISPEAPVPVVEIKEENKTCGGAGNVASNISDLGAKAYIISVIGDDTASTEILGILKKKNINIDYILTSKNHKTIEKIRIIAEHQQIARVDKDHILKYDLKIKNQIFSNLEKITETGIDALILSDYGKGLLIPETIKKIIDICLKKHIPVFVDPKIEHFKSYRNVTSITPNVMEAFGGMRKIIKYGQNEIEELGEKIVKSLNLKSLIITQSENGMTIFENKGKIKATHIPTRAKEVFDVTGAGDTVISTLSLAYSVSRDIITSAIIANHAAGIVVAKLGTATTNQEELKKEIKSWTIQ